MMTAFVSIAERFPEVNIFLRVFICYGFASGGYDIFIGFCNEVPLQGSRGHLLIGKFVFLGGISIPFTNQDGIPSLDPRLWQITLPL